MNITEKRMAELELTEKKYKRLIRFGVREWEGYARAMEEVGLIELEDTIDDTLAKMEACGSDEDIAKRYHLRKLITKAVALSKELDIKELWL